MKAYITADLSKPALQKLKDILKDDIIIENWRDTGNLYFNDQDLLDKITEIGAEILICEGDNVKKTVIENSNLKIIGSTRGDPNNIDVKTATSRNIPVLFAPNRNTQAVAELTVGLILNLARKIHSVDKIVHDKNEFEVNEFKDYVKYYNLFRGMELHGKKVGIIGLGRIGFTVAKLLFPFQVEFLIYDPYVSSEKITAINGKAVELHYLMKNSDIITLHCPPIDETDDMIGEEEIKLMKQSALFINLARASIVHEDALYEALKNHRIAGAALDVFSIEPVDQENEFLSLDNVIVTPHIGGDTYETTEFHSNLIIDAIEQILDNKIPPNVSNPEVLRNRSYSSKESDVSKEIDVSGLQITLQHYRVETTAIIAVCKKMLQKEYVIGSAGNVSMRVTLPDGSNAFLVTPSNVEYDNLQIEDIVLVDSNGNTILGKRNPTSERRVHLAIYRARADVSAIVHSHAPYSTTLSINRMPIGPIVDEIIPFIGGCEVAEFGMAGTNELAQNAVHALGENLAVLIANHGNVCCGKTMSQAWTVCQQVEMAAKIQYRAAVMGTVYALPEEAEETEKEIFDIMRDVGC